MPMHRGVVIRADHSGMVRPGAKRRPSGVTYRAVFAEKVFRGPLESVIQQIDDALGSTPTARIPVPLPPPPPQKKAAAPKPQGAKPAAKKSAKKRAGKATAAAKRPVKKAKASAVKPGRKPSASARGRS